jgi:diacylglycerol kinase (ATP)
LRRYYCILNPLSGGGKSYRIIPTLQEAFSLNSIAPVICLTTKSGEAISLAQDAVRQGFTNIISIGGDGTVNEVVNGIANSDCVLGVIPTGSGNDFARTVYSNKISLEHVLKIIAQNNVRAIDLGLIRSTTTDGKVKKKYFANGVGIGLDARVAFEAKQLNWLPSRMIYIAAALKTIIAYNSSQMSLYNQEFIDANRYLLVAVGNGKSAGGGFYLTPEADLSDGMYDVCMVKDANVAKILKIFPTVFKGMHGKFPEVKFIRTNEFRVKSSEGVPIHVDGEIFGLCENDIEITLKHKALRILAP